MRVAITGFPGWLGNRFVAVLSDKTHHLQKYNKFSTREVRCLVLPSMMKDLPQRPNVSYVAADITKPETLSGTLDGVETLFHFAGIIHPKRVKEFYSLHTDGTKNLLDEAIRAGVKRIIFISSNSVAGVGKPGQLFKETDAYDPYMNYGISKMQAEEVLLRAATDKKIEVTIFRFCWFYGPDQPHRQTRFFKMIQKGNPIIFGDGSNLRSMSYVDNSIQALFLAEGNPVAANQIYWVADERPYPTIEIYETIAKLLGVTLKPRFVPHLASTICYYIDRLLQAMGLYIPEFHVAGEMNKTIACSIEKARKELGYNPETSLEEGMRRSIEWCKANGRL